MTELHQRRNRLGLAIKLLLGVAALMLLYVFFRGIGGSSRIAYQPKKVFDDVEVGQTAPRRLGSQRVWVTRLSTQQRQEAKAVEPWLVNPEEGCAVTATLCVLPAGSNRAGIDIVYTLAPPKFLAPDIKWFGGFVDPTTGAIYDRLGRAYENDKSVYLGLRVIPASAYETQPH